MEPHLASGIMSIEWFDDQTIIVYSQCHDPYIGCASVYDVSTKKLIMEKNRSKYSFGDTLKSFVYVESAPRNLGRDKIVNSLKIKWCTKQKRIRVFWILF